MRVLTFTGKDSLTAKLLFFLTISAFAKLGLALTQERQREEALAKQRCAHRG